MTGSPRNAGSSSCSTAAKNASRSTWRIVALSRTLRVFSMDDPHVAAAGAVHFVAEPDATARLPTFGEPRRQRLAYPRRARREPLLTFVRRHERRFDDDAVGI